MGVCVKKPEGVGPSSKKQDQAFMDQKLSSDELTRKHKECHNCGECAPSRMRCFSAQAWSVLLLWNEINAQTVEKPICDYCYSELRAILMERMDEFDAAVLEVSQVNEGRVNNTLP